MGSTYDGVVRQYALNEQACVEIPSNLSYREAAALPCAVVTAWNALYKGPIKCCRVIPFQFRALGASTFLRCNSPIWGAPKSSQRLAMLKRQLNSRLKGLIMSSPTKRTHDTEERRRKSRTGVRGQTSSLRLVGASTMTRFMPPVTIDGQIAVIGSRADVQESPYAGLHTTSTMIIRGVLVGSRQLNDAINTAIKINNLHPVIESRV
ncbi:unnamed protein product [Aspergillus oryzae]|nr:unnamed protein product [Aspergillus oryzae]GMF96296.1 unnamed protein product [Aspergillus oryzae]